MQNQARPRGNEICGEAQDLAHAFNLLLIEELQKKMPAGHGWEVQDLGRSVCLSNFQSSLMVKAVCARVKGGFDYELEFADYTPFRHFFYHNSHFFRVDTSYLPPSDVEAILVMSHTHQRLLSRYQGRPVMSSRLFFSDNANALYGWKPGEDSRTVQGINGLLTTHGDVVRVCSRIVYPMNEPDSHVKLAGKIYMAMSSYLMTKQALPEH
jgi:hypothetical protein